MRTEKHIIKNRYSTHGIHRDIHVYEMNTVHCSASPMEGYKGTEVTLIDNAAWNEKFSAWALTGATATGNNIVLNNDVTAQGVYETATNLTLQTNGNGTIAANKTSGFIGDQVTLSNTPNTDYEFSAYDITGATLTGNKFNFIGNDVTAKAIFTVTGYIPSSTYRAWNWDGEYSHNPVKNYKITSGEYYYSPYTAASAATLDRQLFNTYYYIMSSATRRSNTSVVSLTVPTASIDRDKNPTYSQIRLQAKVHNGSVVTLWQKSDYLSSAGRYDFLFYIKNSGYYDINNNAVYISGFIDKQLFYTTAIGTESTENQYIEWARYNFGQNYPITTDKIATANAFSYASYDDAVNSIMLR